MIVINQKLSGRILDVGGGGEGIIGLAYGKQVVAIDNCQEELDDAPDGFEKILMDATELKFEDNSFEHITFFYSLMFMSMEEQKQALAEAVRVLKPSGKIYLWDTLITSAYPNPFYVELDIAVDGRIIHTTYGVVKEESLSKADDYIVFCEELNLKLIEKQVNKDQYYLCFEK